MLLAFILGIAFVIIFIMICIIRMRHYKGGFFEKDAEWDKGANERMYNTLGIVEFLISILILVICLFIS